MNQHEHLAVLPHVPLLRVLCLFQARDVVLFPSTLTADFAWLVLPELMSLSHLL